jgi:hypothetical protein
MTATEADIGWGAKIAKGDGADPEVFTDFAEVSNLTPPGFTRDKEEATHLQSPDKYKEYVPSLFDTGDASLTLNFKPSATDAVFAAFHADPANYQITFPDGVMMRFFGFFTSYDPPEMTAQGVMQAGATITRSSGKPTLHAAE